MKTRQLVKNGSMFFTYKFRIMNEEYFIWNFKQIDDLLNKYKNNIEAYKEVVAVKDLIKKRWKLK